MSMLFDQLRHALETGSLFSLLLALILAFLGGVLSSFTPCIYPMIPITIGLIGATEEKSWKDGLSLSSFYVLGLATVYSALGMFAALSGRIFGTVTNSIGWYLALGIIMTVSSLWMLDVIQFDPNVWIEQWKRNRAHRKKSHTPHTQHQEHKNSIWGAFALGASSGFVAAPCTTPILTTILGYVAGQGSVVFGTLLMFSFALGLGTILVFVGTFAGALKLLPRSGNWLTFIKKASGILILAIGEYYIFKAGKLI